MLNTVVMVLGLAAIGGALWLCQSYRELTFCRGCVGESWRQLQDELTARREMIPYLLASVPAAAVQLVDVAGNACDLAAHVAGVRESAQAEGRLTAAMGRLFELLDSRPEARADTNFLTLRGRLHEADERIGMLKDTYNRQAETLNALLKRGPARLLAHFALLSEAECF